MNKKFKNENNSDKKSSVSSSELMKPLDTATESSVTSDVDGSYTGHPIDGGEPIQDADDL